MSWWLDTGSGAGFGGGFTGAPLDADLWGALARAQQGGDGDTLEPSKVDWTEPLPQRDPEINRFDGEAPS